MDIVLLFALCLCVSIAVMIWVFFGYYVVTYWLELGKDWHALSFTVGWVAFGLCCIIYTIGAV